MAARTAKTKRARKGRPDGKASPARGKARVDGGARNKSKSKSRGKSETTSSSGAASGVRPAPVRSGTGEDGPLPLALPRGRILDEALALFGHAGYDMSEVSDERRGRKLIVDAPQENMRVLIVRDVDVPAYVEHGAAHLGIAGKDVLEEQDRDLYEPLDLGIGRCRLMVAESLDHPADTSGHVHLRYATKFTELTRRFLQERGEVAEIIKLYGSIELAPLVGLADRIVDLVSTGETLRQNRLHEVETIMDISARLCVGRAASRLFASRIDDLVDRLANVIGS